MRKKLKRARLFRDPIHGDMRMGPVQTAIIDSPIFQRLRYIKQNGLLHFVFPGAVHTRFAHSIGAAYVAQRVFNNLIQDINGRKTSSIENKSILYVEQVFITAALLHDCGHSAFSHSIEGVRMGDGKPIFRSLEELSIEWSTDRFDLKSWLESVRSSGLKTKSDHISHEEIGLLLIAYLNNYEHLEEMVAETVQCSLSDFLQDVQSLIDQNLTFSSRFGGEAAKVAMLFPKADEIDERHRASQLHAALSSLISGTLDVDRMDYLLRDSHYTGTVYGLYDFDVLVNSIKLGVWFDGDESQLLVCLQERACSAFDDFLWSRYQLFNQVLNHKCNVMLNAMLEEALNEIIDSPKSRIARPRDFKEFIAFSDELIMSDVIVASLNEDRNRLYKRVLVDRNLPMYLGRVDISHLSAESPNSDKGQSEIEATISERKQRHAAELNLKDASIIRTKLTQSTLLKNVAMPYVIRNDKTSGEDIVEPFLENDSYQLFRWSADASATNLQGVAAGGNGIDSNRKDGEDAPAISSGIPATIKHVHFFIDNEEMSRKEPI